MREDEHRVARPELHSLQDLVRPRGHGVRDGGEPRRLEEGPPWVGDRHPVAEALGERRQRRCEVDRAEDHHPRRLGEGGDVDAHPSAERGSVLPVVADQRTALRGQAAGLLRDVALEQFGAAEPAGRPVCVDVELGPGVLAVEQGGQRRRARLPDRGQRLERRGTGIPAQLMDEDVDGPAAHQADGAGELVGDPIGDQARRPFLGEDRHGLLRHGALHAAAGDRALDRLVLGDVDARPDVERGGPVHGDERPRRHAPARFQPFGHGGRGLLRGADHAASAQARRALRRGRATTAGRPRSSRSRVVRSRAPASASRSPSTACMPRVTGR